MSRHRPRVPRPRSVRVPTLVAEELRRQGKRQGYEEARRLSWWRRLRIALRIARGAQTPKP
jgi:hypothetical protein